MVCALILAIAAATASFACLEASSISVCDCTAFGTVGLGAESVDTRGVDTGGTNDLWLTANGMAGVTRLAFGWVGGAFAAGGSCAVSAIVDGASTALGGWG